MSSENDGERSGLSVNYYKVPVTAPTKPGAPPYVAECNDIIESLGMTFAEANVFKAIWRSAAERTLGKKKAGNNAVYDAEKMVFFSNRVLVQAQRKASADKPKEVIARPKPTLSELIDNALAKAADVPTGVVPRYSCGTPNKE